MDPSIPCEWTAALVLRGLRLAYAAEPRLDEPSALFRFVAERARDVLGPDSPEYVALVLRAAPAPGLSIREMCREHYGWHRSRSELYRRSRNGAVRVAAALTDQGVAVPAGLERRGKNMTNLAERIAKVIVYRAPVWTTPRTIHL